MAVIWRWLLLRGLYILKELWEIRKSGCYMEMAVVESFLQTKTEFWEIRKVAVIGMWLLSRCL